MVGDIAAYETVLTDLRAQRVKIDAAIAAIEELMPAQIKSGSAIASGAHAVLTQQVNEPKLPKRLDGRFAGMTIIDASMQVLNDATGPLHVSSITDAIIAGGVQIAGDVNNTVGSILNRRAREKGDVLRIGRGTWASSSHKLSFEHLEEAINSSDEDDFRSTLESKKEDDDI